MGDQTGISWTDATWNPIRGCSRVSEGCRHCYAEQVAARFAGPGQPYEGLAKKVGGEARWTGKVVLVEEHLTDPLRWRKPRRIFVNSMSDLFHEDVPDESLDRILAVMALAPRHTFQVLTKRPERMLAYMTGTAGGSTARRRSMLEALGVALELAATNDGHLIADGRKGDDSGWVDWPLPNVHLGVSVEDQEAADERIPLLLQTPAAVRWISAEPLLGSIAIGQWLHGRDQDSDCPVGDPSCEGEDGDCHDACERPVALDWVVAGGESGPGHRTMDLEWLENLVAQCKAWHVPVWVKQDSGPKPGRQGRIPDALWIQEPPR